jgi:RNA polymerase sigma-70 factor (ECF subfamily)
VGFGDDAASRQLLEGEVNTFSILAERHRRQVFGTCMRIVRNRETAEDCVQTSLAMAFEHLSQFRGDAPFPAWLNRIATNVALSHLRKRRAAWNNEVPLDAAHQGIPAVQLADTRSNPERACYSRELDALVHDAIDGLPPRLRSVVLLRAFGGLSVDHTASVLGVTPQAVKSRMLRAHVHMRRALSASISPRERPLRIPLPAEVFHPRPTRSIDPPRDHASAAPSPPVSERPPTNGRSQNGTLAGWNRPGNGQESGDVLHDESSITKVATNIVRHRITLQKGGIDVSFESNESAYSRAPEGGHELRANGC